jgi:hypothetical protein
VVRPEDVEQQFRALKAGLESGAITEEEFETEIGSFLFQDELGSYWTIAAHTEKWYRHEDGEWVRAEPPFGLERAERRMERPQEAPDDRSSTARRMPPAPVLITLATLLFVACLLAVAMASYQYGRMSVMAPLATKTAAASMVASPSATAKPVRSPTSSGEQTPAAEVATATLAPTVEEKTATSVPPPSPTLTPLPSATSTPVREFLHEAPSLLEPEDGTERGPGYEAVLIWKAAPDLKDDEYYHVEVCWNDCTVYWGDYVRDTSWTFPDFLRGQSTDTIYHWHVTVRRQVSDAPAGPADPATSPTSDTWKFLLPEA